MIMDKDRINRLTQMAIEYLHHNGISDSFIQLNAGISNSYEKYIVIHTTEWVENDETIGISDDVICAIIFGTLSELKVWPYLCVDRDKLVFIAAYEDGVVHKKETDKAINKTEIIRCGCNMHDFKYGGAVTINLGKQLKKNEYIEHALGKIIAEIKPLFETSVKIRTETQKEINLQKFKKAVEDI